MKYILPLFSICLFASCFSYQVMTVSSPDAELSPAHEFVIRNDSLELYYKFNGYCGPVQLRIRNKLQQPLYIDWKRSALVINEQAISYAPNTVMIDGSISAASYRWTKEWTTSYSQLQASAQLPPDMDFIPPQAYVTKTLIGITNRPMGHLPDSLFTQKKVVRDDLSVEKIQQATFTLASSPLVFKSYLTVLIGDTLPRPVAYQHEFYVSELVRRKQYIDSARGNQFYLLTGSTFNYDSTGYGIVGNKALLAGQAIRQ